MRKGCLDQGCRNKDYPEVALWFKYTWILITANGFTSHPSEKMVASTTFAFYNHSNQ